MSSQKRWATGYLIAFIVMIFLNYWSGTNVGSVADANQAIIQPAGFTFSIWGLIYVLLFAWIIKLFFSGDGPSEILAGRQLPPQRIMDTSFHPAVAVGIGHRHHRTFIYTF